MKQTCSRFLEGRYTLGVSFTGIQGMNMRRWLRSVLVAISLVPVSTWANPFASLSVLPSGETSATGKTLYTLEDGDYVEPLFSPDSRYLAFAREASESSAEPMEIRALDLKNFHVKKLLDAKASREFAAKSFIAGFMWKNSRTLKATISDGDVNGIDLIFDVESGKLIERKPISLADDAPGRESALISEFSAAFPSIPPPVLENALTNGFNVGNGKYVVQKNYWKQDNHVWLLDAGRKEMVKLIEIPDVWIYSLRGAFASGDALILLVAYGQEAYLVRYVGGKLELLYRFPVKNYQQTGMRVEHARGGRVLFQINTGASYEKRNNYFFAYDNARLKKIRDTDAIYDLDVDSSGKLVCFSQWKDNQRKLVVKELKEIR